MELIYLMGFSSDPAERVCNNGKCSHSVWRRLGLGRTWLLAWTLVGLDTGVFVSMCVGVYGYGN